MAVWNRVAKLRCGERITRGVYFFFNVVLCIVACCIVIFSLHESTKIENASTYLKKIGKIGNVDLMAVRSINPILNSVPYEHQDDQFSTAIDRDLSRQSRGFCGASAATLMVVCLLGFAAGLYSDELLVCLYLGILAAMMLFLFVFGAWIAVQSLGQISALDDLGERLYKDSPVSTDPETAGKWERENADTRFLDKVHRYLDCCYGSRPGADIDDYMASLPNSCFKDNEKRQLRRERDCSHTKFRSSNVLYSLVVITVVSVLVVFAMFSLCASGCLLPYTKEKKFRLPKQLADFKFSG